MIKSVFLGTHVVILKMSKSFPFSFVMCNLFFPPVCLIIFLCAVSCNTLNYWDKMSDWRYSSAVETLGIAEEFCLAHSILVATHTCFSISRGYDIVFWSLCVPGTLMMHIHTHKRHKNQSFFNWDKIKQNLAFNDQFSDDPYIHSALHYPYVTPEVFYNFKLKLKIP